jgi:hypothetical protein
MFRVNHTNVERMMIRFRKPFSFLTMAFILFSVSPVGAQWMALEDDPKGYWAVEARFGAYDLGEIDGESFAGGVKPFREVFGYSQRFMFQMSVERYLWRGFGTIGLQATFGHLVLKGKGVITQDDGTYEKASGEPVEFNVLPFKLHFVYRASFIEEKWGVPLVPYIKGGFNYYMWWILNNRDNIARYRGSTGGKAKGLGGTFGMEGMVGLAFSLDWIDPASARTFELEIGVKNTYLFAEYGYAWMNDFTAGNSFDLSDDYFMAGLMFEF